MELRLIEAASEIGAGKRGASMGMAALRVAAWKLGSELFGHAEESILRDENDVLYEDDSSPNAHHIDGLIRFESDLAYEVYKYLQEQPFLSLWEGTIQHRHRLGVRHQDGLPERAARGGLDRCPRRPAFALDHPQRQRSRHAPGAADAHWRRRAATVRACSPWTPGTACGRSA
jgi:hypothetical protein